MTPAERSRRWRLAHPGRAATQGRAWRSAHLEEERVRSRQRRLTSPWMKAERAASSARWYAKRYGIDPGHLTREIFARLHLLPCSYCGKLPAMGVDHVLPLARGGTNALANLVAACLPCNQSKGASVA